MGVAAPYTRVGRRWQVYGMVDTMQRDDGDRNRLEFPERRGGWMMMRESAVK